MISSSLRRQVATGGAAHQNRSSSALRRGGTRGRSGSAPPGCRSDSASAFACGWRGPRPTSSSPRARGRGSRGHAGTGGSPSRANTLRDFFVATPYKLVDLADPDSEATAIRWWEELTERGGEGMVVKQASGHFFRNRCEGRPTGRHVHSSTFWFFVRYRPHDARPCRRVYRRDGELRLHQGQRMCGAAHLQCRGSMRRARRAERGNRKLGIRRRPPRGQRSEPDVGRHHRR